MPSAVTPLRLHPLGVGGPQAFTGLGIDHVCSRACKIDKTARKLRPKTGMHENRASGNEEEERAWRCLFRNRGTVPREERFSQRPPDLSRVVRELLSPMVPGHWPLDGYDYSLSQNSLQRC